MVDPITVLYVGALLFVLVTVGSYLGATLALRSFHEDERPSVSAAIEILRPGNRN